MFGLRHGAGAPSTHLPGSMGDGGAPWNLPALWGMVGYPLSRLINTSGKDFPVAGVDVDSRVLSVDVVVQL